MPIHIFGRGLFQFLGRLASRSKVVALVAQSLKGGNCGPSGGLSFILEQFPSLGAICRLHTGSKASVPNLSNAVAQLHSWNGGRLKGAKASVVAQGKRDS